MKKPSQRKTVKNNSVVKSTAKNNKFDSSKALFEAIQKAESVLIIPSTPVDADSLCSSLALSTWIQSLNKRVDLMSFRDYASIFPNSYPSGKLVKHVDFLTIDFSKFDIVIIIDGSGWVKSLGENYEEILKVFPIEKCWLIDHHDEGIISNDLKERVILEQMISASEVLYKNFFKKNRIKISKEIASYLYFAQVDDSQRFHHISKDTYKIANELLSFGLNHPFTIDKRISEESFRFTGWAIQHSLVFPFIQTIMLPVYESDVALIKSMFGENWLEKDLDDFFKQEIMRSINGYNYGLTIFALDNGKTEVRWRTRDVGLTLSIADVLKNIKKIEQYGGHRNSGGATYLGTVSDCIKDITSEMEKQIKDLHLENSGRKEWINYSENW